MKKILFLLLLSLLVISSCSNNETCIIKNDVLDYYRKNYKDTFINKSTYDQESLDRYIETLSDEEKIGQLFLISLDGNNIEQLSHIMNTNEIAPGGYLLFAFNIADTAEEMIDFLSELQCQYLENELIPPFISIDHEGGVVNRLRNICSKLPSQLNVAERFSITEATRLYELQGEQLYNLGIHVNIAPVVEVLTDENIQFLDDRSFGNIDNVLKYSEAQIKGMTKTGVLPVLKHFPGNTNNDPHTGLPVLKCDLKTFEDVYLTPFYELKDDYEPGILVAHTVVPEIDEKPACLSEKIISLLDYQNKSYNGLIFSDDLLMKALIKNGYPVEKSLIGAIKAGINILMISTGSFDQYADIVLQEYHTDPDFKKKVDDSVKKILEWKISCNLLQRDVVQNGFFTYEASVSSITKENPDMIENRKKAFHEAYDEASALYNEVWWK